MTAELQGIPKDWLQPHPVLPLPTRQMVQEWLARGEPGRAHLEKVLRDRAELIAREKDDPLYYGYEPQPWKDFRALVAAGFREIYVSGANREGKSTLLAKFIVQDLLKRKCEWAMFHNTETTSKRQQQRAIFSMLPPEWRKRAQSSRRWRHGGEGERVYLNYDPATGFTGNQLILPQTQSIGYFFNYMQSSTVWEGPEYDGMYFEEGVTLGILETSRYRLSRERELLILVNFTPKWGYTPAVANLLAGARIVETRPAPLLAQDRVHVKGCPPGHMPYIMHGARERSAIIFFHNRMNPMGAGLKVMKELVGAPATRVMIRGYGWADKLAASAFPTFGDAHIVEWDRFLELVKRGGTFYCSADPAGARNWFIQWWFVTPQGWSILYREWPDKARYEEWALSPADTDENDSNGTIRKHDWREGPAQRLEAGRSVASYKALILEAEGWRYNTEKKEWEHVAGEFGPGVEKIARRVMDPRFGGDPVPSGDETTIIDLMLEDGKFDRDQRVMPVMDWEQAPGSYIEESVQMLANDMDWRESEPLSQSNCPKLYVVRRCEQSSLAFREFTMASSSKNALKDPIDAARYFKKSDCRYMAPGTMKVRGGGHW